MAGLSLKTISYMADKFPDKWMEKIPYYRPQDDKNEKESRRSKRSPSRKHSRRSSRREYRDDRYYDDEDSEDLSGPEDYDYRDHRGPHRSKSVGGRRYEDPQKSFRPRSYVPADYVPQAYGTQPAYPAYANMNYSTAPPPVAPEASPTRAAYRNPAAPDMSPTRAGYRTAATPSVSPTRAAYRESSPHKASGPIPGYVPYAEVYHGRREAPRDQAYPGASQRGVGYYNPDDHRSRDSGSRAESRSSRRNNDAYYESDRRDYRGYDSDGDAGNRRRSRRHHR